MGRRTWGAGRRLALPLLFAALGLSGCGRGPQSMLDPAGPVAETQFHLLNFDLTVVSIIGAAVIALILYVVFRFRARPGDESVPSQVSGNPRLEIGWTLGAVAILIPLAVEPISATFALAKIPTGSDVVQVHVVGHQWWWEFQYPEYGITTANEMVIPAGKRVSMTITSVDVIHSFWVPRLGGKVDALPGRTNTLWLESPEAGSYLGQCAELCGTSHALMRLQVIAKPPADFAAWVKAQSETVDPNSFTADGQQAWKLFNDKGCIGCHTIDGTTAQGKVGPNLTHLSSRTMSTGGVGDTSAEFLTQWLKNPPAVKPRTAMPNLSLKDDEVNALVTWLRSMK